MEKAMVGERDGRSCRDAVAGLELRPTNALSEEGTWQAEPTVKSKSLLLKLQVMGISEW